MTEQEYVARTLAGDEDAFTPLVETYQTAIYNLCYRILGDGPEAEDAAQETFLRAYAQLRRYDRTRSFKTWLFSIASHHCIDRLRKRRLTWLSIEDEDLAPHPNLREAAPGPEASALRREHTTAVQKYLARLAPEDRNMIVLRYWYDLSYEEIAEASGATVSAVKSRLHRARGAMAEMMQTPSPAPARQPALAVEGMHR